MQCLIFSIVSRYKTGGILSPILFAVFVNSIFVKFKKSKLGCFVKQVCCNSFMYADDLILLSISLTEMQRLIDICVADCKVIGMEINSRKSACMRIGSRRDIRV